MPPRSPSIYINAYNDRDGGLIFDFFDFFFHFPHRTKRDHFADDVFFLSVKIFKIVHYLFVTKEIFANKFTPSARKFLQLVLCTRKRLKPRTRADLNIIYL